MFDNAYDEGKSSRMLIVEVDEAKLEAREAWEFKTGAYTPVYGDNDRLPTGNLLGSFWLNSFDAEEWSDAGDAETRDAYEQFDARAMELVRATKLRAWSASVQGRLCERGTCDNSKRGEWRMYSVERFYTAPLVHSVTCASAGSGSVLSFASHNNFKQNNPDPAHWYILDSAGNEVMDGAFSFRPHWAPATVTVTFASDSKLGTGEESGSIRVKNKWGDTTTESFSCG